MRLNSLQSAKHLDTSSWKTRKGQSLPPIRSKKVMGNKISVPSQDNEARKKALVLWKITDALLKKRGVTLPFKGSVFVLMKEAGICQRIFLNGYIALRVKLTSKTSENPVIQHS